MTTVEYVTVDPCSEIECRICESGERALRITMDTLAERLPGGRRSEIWRSLDAGNKVMIEHTALEGRWSAEGAPYLVVDGEVLAEGTDIDPETLGITVAKIIYPDGWD